MTSQTRVQYLTNFQYFNIKAISEASINRIILNGEKTIMIKYTSKPESELKTNQGYIASFTTPKDENIDWNTVESFGEEWNKFDSFSEEEIAKIGDDYFDIVPESHLNQNTTVLDMGCGSGRWSYYMADKVKSIEAVDPSEAVFTAQKMLKKFNNIRVSQAAVQNLPFPNETFDLVISLGVLHHIPNTPNALKQCVEKVKKGGACLIYLYYNLDNRGFLFRLIFMMSNLIRKVISKLPVGIKKLICDAIAILVYYPLSRFSGLLHLLKAGKIASEIPLSYYRDKSLTILRNDALDRFGTPLEQRFSKKTIKEMMQACGLKDIVFSSSEPYWHAIGYKTF